MSGAAWFAYVAILAWPLAALGLYRIRPFSEATAWVVLGALLLLPSQVSIKFEMIPSIDKTLVGNLSMLAGCLFFAPRTKGVFSLFSIVGLLAVTYVLSPVVTSALNGDDALVGGRLLPGVGYYDGVSALISQTIVFLPFLLARRFLASTKDVETLLRVLVVAGLLYSLPMLFEIRMSPQLSQWIYGYFPSSYATEARYGGFRPVVFMVNGLATAFFLATALLAAAALWRTKVRVSPLPSTVSFAYLGLVLVLCKSAGALLYGLVAGTMARWSTPKFQVRVAVVLASIALMYPVLRLNGYIPAQSLVELASTFNKDRAQSLHVRFEQEDRLLTHAAERFWFGWGRYGRSRVYDERGEDTTLSDGQWIITFGQFGLVGFIAQFGLLTLPVFSCWRVISRLQLVREGTLVGTLALIVALTAIEQLPNASTSPWSWLLAGALFGVSERIRLGRRLSPTSASARNQPNSLRINRISSPA
ncbi:hypothetical protein JQ612_27570 [Bradyrhizobium manausense]|uniref:hypothetical protein n=1 Tax=Bradyrhizobium manausense TaxID=989370 RepID=UPI001BA4B75D|nr:hypothetical protein [Bradyrhizobium manausense]MBR0836971.1 hypothetical protein [Bradyrhizobium manausense]